MSKNESLYKSELLSAAEYLGVQITNLEIYQYSEYNISGSCVVNGQKRPLPKVSATDTSEYRYWAVQAMLNCLNGEKKSQHVFVRRGFNIT